MEEQLNQIYEELQALTVLVGLLIEKIDLNPVAKKEMLEIKKMMES